MCALSASGGGLGGVCSGGLGGVCGGGLDGVCAHQQLLYMSLNVHVIKFFNAHSYIQFHLLLFAYQIVALAFLSLSCFAILDVLVPHVFISVFISIFISVFISIQQQLLMPLPLSHRSAQSTATACTSVDHDPHS